MNTLINYVWYDEKGGPVLFNPDGTMSFYNTKKQHTNFGKYEVMEDSRVKLCMDCNSSIYYLRLVVSEDTNLYLYNSFGGIFAYSREHIPTRIEPTVSDLRGYNATPEPLIPAMIVVHSIKNRAYETLCKRHWIWKAYTTKKIRFQPNGIIVELEGVHNTPVEVGSWTVPWDNSGDGTCAIYQPPGDWRNVRKVITRGCVHIIFGSGSSGIYMYVMVDPKDESLVYLQQELSTFKVIDEDTVRLVDMQGRQACYAERVT